MDLSQKNIHVFYIQRLNGKNVNISKIEEQVSFIVDRSILNSKNFKIIEKNKIHESKRTKEKFWSYKYELVFKYVGSDSKLQDLKKSFEEKLSKYCNYSTFGKYPWIITSKEDKVELIEDKVLEETISHLNTDDIKHLAPEQSKVPSWKDLSFPQELLYDDNALSEHPAFKNIYGLNAQIRTILSSIKSAIDTDGSRRNHTVLWGKPACGKTQVVLALENLLGPNSVLRLDATSTTRAGLEKLFFKDLVKIPPIVVCEEIEKAKEEWLQIWLGALDDRGEIRKINFRTCLVREVRILFICTVNDKNLFDKMMGGEGSGKPGALSSRCVNDVYFPRPDINILRSILRKDIICKGGKTEFIEPCIELSQLLKINDPRKVLSFLSGGERLLTGEYQKDLLKIFESQEKIEM
jgi:hypothetical protein